MGVGGPPSPSRTCPRGGQWLGRVPTLRAPQRLACAQSGGVSDTPAGDGALLSRGRNNEAALQNALFCSRLFWMSEKSRGALRGVSKADRVHRERKTDRRLCFWQRSPAVLGTHV